MDATPKLAPVSGHVGRVGLELADATHKPIPGAAQVVEFTIPSQK